MDKFEVVEGSEKGHCCVTHTIIDKSKPTYHCDDIDKTGEPICYGVVCECFDEDTAIMISLTMNKMVELAGVVIDE